MGKARHSWFKPASGPGELMSSLLNSEIDEQRAANRSALPYRDLYAGHREQLTRQMLDHAGADSARSLCVLGAGNCYDLDLASVSAAYREVHLVDLDESALAEAMESADPAVRARVVCHAPVDLSGMLGKLERYQRFLVTPEDLMEQPARAASALRETLGGPFDVVASTCLVTQMQLALLRTLTDAHRLFAAVRHTLTVTHLRTLASLTRPGGKALFVSDLVDVERLKLPEKPSPAELRVAYDDAMRGGNVIYVAHPDMLRAVIRDDPVLRRDLGVGTVDDLWLWQQGPHRTFLVYALALHRHDAQGN